MYWLPLSGDYKRDLTDVVVVNVDAENRSSGFCGVMTSAGEGGEKKYQICNKQQG